MQNKNSDKARILIVEDEVAIREGLVDVFVYHGFEVDIAADGTLGLLKAVQGDFDLILLDVMLPGVNGFDICQQIREHDKEQIRDQPIIMLTAKSSDDDIIQGLSLGADDYVSKPFSVAQLVLRVKAVLRRSQGSLKFNHQIKLGENLVIDSQNLCVENDQHQRSFTRREMDILLYLQANSERPVSRNELLSKVWGYAEDIELETRTVDIHIAKIRRKIEADPAHPLFLLTVRGAGYRLLATN